MRRRDFISVFGGAALACPLDARAQQSMLVIGVLNASTPQGLRDAGYVEGRNVTIEYRYAENQYDRLPALAADLVRRRVAVIFASGRRCRGAGRQGGDYDHSDRLRPGFDPVQSGLVPRLNRPCGNITGVSFAANLAEAKKLGLLYTWFPARPRSGCL